MSLLPEHGGPVAYLTSVVGSAALFEKEGWADGEDVVSTVARVKFWLANKDLDLAAREANSLSGASLVLSYLLSLLVVVLLLTNNRSHVQDGPRRSRPTGSSRRGATWRSSRRSRWLSGKRRRKTSRPSRAAPRGAVARGV